MNFQCPNPECNGEIDKVDERMFDTERIMGSDDLNADPMSDINTKVELWYCCYCGYYFKVYYKLDKITLLNEAQM